jgi:hypothetical protein
MATDLSAVPRASAKSTNVPGCPVQTESGGRRAVLCRSPAPTPTAEEDPQPSEPWIRTQPHAKAPHPHPRDERASTNPPINDELPLTNRG